MARDTESFSRIVTDGWGTSEWGGPWIVSNTGPNMETYFSVDGTAGRIVSNSTADRIIRTAEGVQFTLPIDLILDFKMQRLISNTGHLIYLGIVDSSLNYIWQANVVATTSGTMNAFIRTSLNQPSGVAVGSLTLWNNIPMRMRFRIESGQYMLKVWPRNNVEPTTWLLSFTHSMTNTAAHLQIIQDTTNTSNNHNVWYDQIIQTTIPDDSTHGDPFSLDAQLMRTFQFGGASGLKIFAFIADPTPTSNVPAVTSVSSISSPTPSSGFTFTANHVTTHVGDLVVITAVTAGADVTNVPTATSVQNWNTVETVVPGSGIVSTYWKFWQDEDMYRSFITFSTVQASDGTSIDRRRVAYLTRITNANAVQVLPVENSSLTNTPTIPPGVLMVPSHSLLLAQFANFLASTSTTRWLAAEDSTFVEVNEQAVTGASMLSLRDAVFETGGETPEVGATSTLQTPTLAHLIAVSAPMGPLAISSWIYTGEFFLPIRWRTRGMWTEDFSSYSTVGDLWPKWGVDFSNGAPTLADGAFRVVAGVYGYLILLEETYLDQLLHVEFDIYFPPSGGYGTASAGFTVGDGTWVDFDFYNGKIEWSFSGAPSAVRLSGSGGWFHVKLEYPTVREIELLDEIGNPYIQPQILRMKLWRIDEEEPDWQLQAQPNSSNTAPSYPSFYLSPGYGTELRLDNIVVGHITDPLPLRFQIAAVIIPAPSFGISARIWDGVSIETAVWIDDFERLEINRSYTEAYGYTTPTIVNGYLTSRADEDGLYNFWALTNYPGIPPQAAGYIEYDIYIDEYPEDTNVYYEVGAGSTLDPATAKWRRTYTYAYYSWTNAGVIYYTFGVANSSWGDVAVTPGTWYSIKARIPANLSEPYGLKVWPRSEPEPTSWTFTGIDGGANTAPASFIYADPGVWMLPRFDNIVITSEVRAFLISALVQVPETFRIQAVITGAPTAPAIVANAIIKGTRQPSRSQVAPYVVASSEAGLYSSTLSVTRLPTQVDDIELIIGAARYANTNFPVSNLVSVRPTQTTSDTSIAGWNLIEYFAAPSNTTTLFAYWRRVTSADTWTRYYFQGTYTRRFAMLMVIRGASGIVTTINPSVGTRPYMTLVSSSTLSSDAKTLSYTVPSTSVYAPSSVLVFGLQTGTADTYWNVSTPSTDPAPWVQQINTLDLNMPVTGASLMAAWWESQFYGTVGPLTSTPNTPDINAGLLFAFAGPTTQFEISARVGAGGRMGINAYISPTAQQTTHLRTGPHYDQTAADYIYTLATMGSVPSGSSLHEVLEDLDQQITDLEEQR